MNKLFLSAGLCIALVDSTGCKKKEEIPLPRTEIRTSARDTAAGLDKQTETAAKAAETQSKAVPDKAPEIPKPVEPVLTTAKLETSPNPQSPVPSTSTGAEPSHDQVASGLKEALAKGVENAIASLGKEGGFLTNVDVKIPMPASLKKAESLLRTLKQDILADDFVATMNRAAEKAVPEAAVVLGDAIKKLTVIDAQTILTGANNAATEYFRRTSETNLAERLLPIVSKATSEAGVTGAYKKMMSKASFAGSVLGPDSGDIDGYVTHKALDGLFLKIAEEEKRIRDNPVARTTDLLKSVFGKIKPKNGG